MDTLYSAEELTSFLNGKEYRHGDYCHYTKLGIIKEILLNKQLWLSCCAESFNDEIDKEQFKNNKNIFGICFSTGKNENLSLWYLYAGMNGRGGRLRFTKSQIKKLIETSTYELWECNENGDKLNKKLTVLEDGITMKKTFKDVLYYKISGNRVDLKYNNEHRYGFPLDEFEKYKEKNIGFLKGLIWYYEKETRLLVELIGVALKEIDNDKKYKVVMNFDEKLYKKIKLDLAPEILSIDEIYNDNSDIKEFVQQTSNVSLSEHSGSLKMNLCKNCNFQKEAKK